MNGDAVEITLMMSFVQSFEQRIPYLQRIALIILKSDGGKYVVYVKCALQPYGNWRVVAAGANQKKATGKLPR